MLSYEQFKKNADTVRQNIVRVCRSCRRDPSEVQLLAVTKAHPPEAVDFAARYGLAAVGENRVQEAIGKKPLVRAKVRWELIGHLQSNKARLAVSLFDRIQSVDRVKLLNALDRYAAEMEKTLPVLLQVNTGEDPRKFGAPSSAAASLLEGALQCPHLRVEGLMTIAPLDEDRSVALSAFAQLRTLRDELCESFAIPLPELSMGMSGDMEEAIIAGSTCLRVGSALYGPR